MVVKMEKPGKEEKDLLKQEKQELKKKQQEERKAAREEKKKNKVPMEPAKKKKVIKRSIIGGVAGIFVLFIVVSNIVSANAKPVVYTSAVSRADIEQVLSTSGSVASEEEQVYFSAVNIKVGTINVKAGETVEKGKPVITYDTTDLGNAKKTAQLKLQATEGSYDSNVQKNNESLGDLGEASTNLPVLEQQIADTENFIKELQKRVEDKKAALAYEGSLLQISLVDWSDKPDSDEYQNLLKLVQSNQYEQGNNKEIREWQDEIARNQELLEGYKEYKAEMKAQKSTAEGTKLNAGGKEALEANSEIEKISAQETLDAITEVENGVLAEFDGVVTEMNAVEGATLAPETRLFKLESTQDVKVVISVTKYDLEKLKTGQKAVVIIAGKEYEGKVTKIDKMATKNASGTPVVNADIKIMNPDDNVYLGVEAKISVSTATAAQALNVPINAVNTDMEGEFVYAVENGVIVKKPVVTGISSDEYIEIKDGLTEGAQILTEVSAGIMEGMAVTAVPMQ